MKNIKKFGNFENSSSLIPKDILDKLNSTDHKDILETIHDFENELKGDQDFSKMFAYVDDIYLDFDEESIRLNLNFLEETDVLPYIDDYDTNVDLGNCLVEIDNNINRLEELKFDLVNIIYRQIQFKKLIGDVDNELRNRFKIYPNFKSMTIGKDMNNVRITFDIIEDESKKNHHLFRKPSGEFN